MSEFVAFELRVVHLPLVSPFRTSFGVETEKECILVRAESASGRIGWGECVAAVDPGFSDEFNAAAWIVMREHLVPQLLSAAVTAEEVGARLAGVRGHRMSKAALEMSVLDAELRERGESLRSYLGGEKDRVEVGVSVGIPASVEALVVQVAGYVEEGYRKVKLKIEPGFDVEPVGAVRAAFPEAPFSVDANAAYSLADVEVFRALDTFDLLMIEQPLSYEDLTEHAKLQRELHTPICLDESVRSAADARAAFELGACGIVNIKQGRVGGLLESRRIHDLARQEGIPVWCGGMLETGIGRAANLALASLPGFTLPGDTSSSSRYFPRDLTEPFVAEDGTMAVPQGPGLGVEPDPARLDEATVEVKRIEGR